MNPSDHDYLSKLLDLLQADYPVLHQLIGDDYFTVMGCRYFQRHPVAEDSTARFGEQLSDFLKKEKPYVHVPSLADVADFESAHRRAVVEAPALEVVTPGYLQALAPEMWAGLTFSLHPALTMIRLEWNAPQIWQALSSGEEVPEPRVNAGFYLVYRTPEGSGWRPSTPLEVAALESVYHGLTFAELVRELQNLVDDVESVPPLAENFIRTWVEQGFLLLRR